MTDARAGAGWNRGSSASARIALAATLMFLGATGARAQEELASPPVAPADATVPPAEQETVPAATEAETAGEAVPPVAVEAETVEEPAAATEEPTDEPGPSVELGLLAAAGEDNLEPDAGPLVAEEDVADEGEEEEEEAEEEEDEEGETSSLHVAIPGYYQLSVFGLAPIALGPDDPSRPFGPNLGQEYYGWSRLRATPELSFAPIKIKAQFDVMTGIIFGQSTQGVDAALEPRMRETGAESDGGGELVGIRPFDFRQLFLEWDTGYGILRAGQMTSNWGLGILANDGDHDQLFGFNRYGDLVERVVFATKPFSTLGDGFYKDIITILGGDLVYRDHLADIWNGDLAWQGIFALLWREEPRQVGMYVAYRNQTFDDGDNLEVVAVDVTADWTFDLAEGWDLQVAGEGVGVFGSTDVARSLTSDTHDIMQFGGALRVAAKYLEQYTAQVEVGAATSDANTYDDQLLRFTFDPDYNVGLIMFEELIAWQTARAATLAASPDLVGEPVPGLELLPTNGGVSGALYVNPTFRARPLEWLEAAVGLLWGYSTADFVSPFEQKVNGVPANYMGGDSGNRNLGVELDVGVNFFIPLRLVQLEAGAQFGYMFLGDAFADADGNRPDDIWLTEGRLALRF
ncbi:MAG: hypothetical protein HY905_00520 [Deltaproteobacteria bacterium]|nr:hypothetical protein [Deltaproteobacteria bacterium]